MFFFVYLLFLWSGGFHTKIYPSWSYNPNCSAFSGCYWKNIDSFLLYQFSSAPQINYRLLPCNCCTRLAKIRCSWATAGFLSEFISPKYLFSFWIIWSVWASSSHLQSQLYIDWTPWRDASAFFKSKILYLRLKEPWHDDLDDHFCKPDRSLWMNLGNICSYRCSHWSLLSWLIFIFFCVYRRLGIPFTLKIDW